MGRSIVPVNVGRRSSGGHGCALAWEVCDFISDLSAHRVERASHPSIGAKGDTACGMKLFQDCGDRLRKSSYTMARKGDYRVVISLLLAVLAAASGPATSAEAATEAAIARVHAVDPQIHAVIALDPTALDQARAIDRGRRARGLLYGYAILLKDNIEAEGPLPTTAGSMALLDNVTHRDAPLVARLRAADARHPGQDEPVRMGEYSVERLHFGLERGGRPDP